MTIQVRDDSNTARTISAIQVRDETNTARDISEIWVRDSNNVSRLVWSLVPPLSLLITPANRIAVTHGTGTATTNSFTATPTGGQSPFTYAWTLLTHDAATPPFANAPTSAVTTMTQTGILPGDSYFSTWKCTVTDDLGSTAEAGCDASFVDV